MTIIQSKTKIFIKNDNLYKKYDVFDTNQPIIDIIRPILDINRIRTRNPNPNSKRIVATRKIGC